MIYPDLEFVSSILVKGDHSRQAAQLLRDLPHPLQLSLLHRLQLENALLRLVHGADPAQAEIARAGLRVWCQYLDEQVLTIQPVDFEAVFVKAATWNAGYQAQPPRWSLLMHLAIAAMHSAVFMSFNRALRRLAEQEGLALLPAILE